MDIKLVVLDLKTMYKNASENMYKGLRSKTQPFTNENILASTLPFGCLPCSEKTPTIRAAFQDPASARVFLGSKYKSVLAMHKNSVPFVIAVRSGKTLITLVTYEDIAF